MSRVEFHVDASEELQAASAYYEDQQPGLGDIFLAEIEQGLHRIQQFPGLWPIYEGDYRRYILRRFPFGIIYRATPDAIFVFAVAHLRREPGYWKGRE